jgi:hypothetical protein
VCVFVYQYLSCTTVFDMRLRITFLRRKNVSLQSNIAQSAEVATSDRMLSEIKISWIPHSAFTIISLIPCHMFVSVRRQNLDFQSHMSWSLLCSASFGERSLFTLLILVNFQMCVCLCICEPILKVTTQHGFH